MAESNFLEHFEDWGCGRCLHMKVLPGFLLCRVTGNSYKLANLRNDVPRYQQLFEECALRCEFFRDYDD